ncbi:hypothetical protein BCR43DRAFT_495008 [Syncephalastrum racemosum]|uniref:Uncharacterized protein n=1 Tax=Syncephalastrum racemosum TaxID=13706 RepID=A0A1X2H8Y6_SYNRA|nr:hypothetical protein BCR43DRAFT_495008 [Syncephalastrum racemosum]
MTTQETPTATPETKPVPPLPETTEHGEVSSGGASADAQTKNSSSNASKRLSLFLDKAKKQFSDKTHKADDKPAEEANVAAPADEGEASASAEESKAKKRFSTATWESIFARSKTPGKDKAEAKPAAEADAAHADAAEVPVQNDETPASPKDQAKEAAQNVLDQVKRSSTYKKYFGKKSTAEGAAASTAVEGEEAPATAAAIADTDEARATTPRDQAKDAAQNVLNQIKRNSTYKKYFGKKSAEEQQPAAAAADAENATAPTTEGTAAAAAPAAAEGASEEHAKETSASPKDQAKDAAQNVLNQIKRNSTYKKYFGKKSTEEQPAAETANAGEETSAAPVATEEHAKEPAASPRDQAKEAAENLIGAIKRNPTYKKYFGKKATAHGEEEATPATTTTTTEGETPAPERATSTPAPAVDEGKKHESTASRAANSPLGRRLTSIIRSFPTNKGNKTTAATEKTEAPVAQDVPATVQATA